MRFNLSIILVLTKFFTTAAEGSLYLQNSKFLIREPLYLTLNQTVPNQSAMLTGRDCINPTESLVLSGIQTCYLHTRF